MRGKIMDKIEFEKVFKKYSKKLDMEISDSQIDKFYKYMEILLEWNQKVNLTAITDCEEMILKHFIDSLTIVNNIDKNSYLVDVGTGAGFPGIPLKIVREDIKIVLLDSLNKRIQFLNEVINKLDLKNIEAVHARVEEFGKNKQYREKFDVATSRAVANLSTLSEYMIPLVKVSGKCICMKGREVEQELQEARNAINILGGKIENKVEFQLLDNDINRNVILISKVKNTPAKYPRKPGTPSKEPIK